MDFQNYFPRLAKRDATPSQHLRQELQEQDQECHQLLGCPSLDITGEPTFRDDDINCTEP